jgi:hypothetical protein
MSEEDGFDAEYTRRKVKLQVGDGPDARGEVTVEMVRERAPEDETTPRHESVVMQTGESQRVRFGTDDAAFAEWVFEVNRSVDVLRDSLGLEDGGDDGE